MITDTLYQSPVIFDYLPDPAMVQVSRFHDIVQLLNESTTLPSLSSEAITSPGLSAESITIVSSTLETLVDSRGPHY